MSISASELETVIKLSAPKRYDYFIVNVVSKNEMWGLYDHGWVMSETDGGESCFLLWSAKEYAELCAGGEWANAEPKLISLNEALNEMIPFLKENETLPGVFFVPGTGSVSVSLEQLEEDLKKELSFYKQGWVRKDTSHLIYEKAKEAQEISQYKYNVDYPEISIVAVTQSQDRKKSFYKRTLGLEKENKQLTKLMALPISERYSYFIKSVVAQNKIYGLYNNGWVLAKANDGRLYFPFWQIKEYSEQYIGGSWVDSEPKLINLNEMFDEILPLINQNDIRPAVCFTPEVGDSIVVTCEEFYNNLLEEFSFYNKGWKRNEISGGDEYSHLDMQNIPLDKIIDKFKSEPENVDKNINLKEFEAIKKLLPEKRYSYFIKTIARSKKGWGLYEKNRGWVVAKTDDEKLLFPIWPAKQYAELCKFGPWKNSEPKAIGLNEMLEDLLPSLKEREESAGIFFIPEKGCVQVSLDVLQTDLTEELSEYE